MFGLSGRDQACSSADVCRIDLRVTGKSAIMGKLHPPLFGKEKRADQMLQEPLVGFALIWSGLSICLLFNGNRRRLGSQTFSFHPGAEIEALFAWLASTLRSLGWWNLPDWHATTHTFGGGYRSYCSLKWNIYIYDLVGLHLRGWLAKSPTKATAREARKIHKFVLAGGSWLILIRSK